MTSRTLESWSAALAFLDADIAAGIEPMARRLDLVLDDRPLATPGGSTPNGYAGLTRSGPVERLMLSEWMLAGAEPDEFMRKLVSAELGYLAVDRSEDRPAGELAVLVDTGPLQLGAPRLAQLAVLVALSRRARASNVPLALGILGDEPGQWVRGELASLLQTWVRSRRARTTHADLDAWLAPLEERSRVWLLTGDRLAPANLPDRVQLLQTSESSWSAHGASSLRVVVDRQREIELDLPEPAAAIRILRGEGLFRYTGDTAERDVAPGRLRFPQFPSAASVVIGRGDDPRILRVAPLSDRGRKSSKHLRSRRFSGPVLAASILGDRIVALVVKDERRLRVEVVGRKLGKVVEIDAPIEAIGLTPTSLAPMTSRPIAPLFYLSGKVAALIDGAWWLFRQDDEPVVPSSFVHLAASAEKLDQPRLVRYRSGRDGVLLGEAELANSAEPPDVHLGAHGSTAYRSAAGSWMLGRDTDDGANPTVEIDGLTAGTTVIVVSTVEGAAVLVTRSSGGHIIRLRGREIDRTLTQASRDGIVHAAVHPTQPLLAVERDNGRIDVFDLDSSRRIFRLQPDGS